MVGVELIDGELHKDKNPIQFLEDSKNGNLEKVNVARIMETQIRYHTANRGNK